MVDHHKANTGPIAGDRFGEPGLCRSGARFTGCEVEWSDSPIPSCLQENESVRLCERILHDLINIGEVDCERVVQIVQLMAYKEFEPFFRALCCVSLEEPARTADRLARCAVRLAPKPARLGLAGG